MNYGVLWLIALICIVAAPLMLLWGASRFESHVRIKTPKGRTHPYIKGPRRLK